MYGTGVVHVTRLFWLTQPGTCPTTYRSTARRFVALQHTHPEIQCCAGSEQLLSDTEWLPL